jgi:hypothetical protein
MKLKNIKWLFLTAFSIIIFSGCYKSTDLKITVYTSDNNTLSDCHVRLYLTEDDWLIDNNSVFSGYTNSEGEITFYNVSTIDYYIDAYRTGFSGSGYYCNWDRAIKIVGIERGELNTCDIFVDYNTSKKSDFLSMYKNDSIANANNSIKINSNN